MDVLGQILDARDDAPKKRPDWFLVHHPPETRLLAFDRWVKERLAQQLDWTWAGEKKEKRIEQCRIRLESMVLELWRRGWMLDGRALAIRIIELLDVVAKYQRSGRVDDFWAYFEACVRRYVGANAEEIREEAMRAGVHMGQWMKVCGIGIRESATTGIVHPPLPELIAMRADEITKSKKEKLREKLARERVREKAEKDQPTLL